MQIEVHGEVKPGFEPVRNAFARLWQNIEVGASLCVYHQGIKVVDLWGGFRDREMTDSWTRDTLVNVYSTTKGPASLAIAMLYDEGKIDYNEKVATYWPEFGAEGKQDITVAQLLSHRAGLCGVETELTVEDLYDWDKMVNLLTAQRPLWQPGEAAGYHAVTWGYFPGELIRRITGKTLGQYFHEKVAAPLNADFFIGLPDAEMDRVATMIGPNYARIQPEEPTNMEMPEFYPIALMNPSIGPYKHASSYAWRKAEIAAANGQANARGVATIYGALAMDGQLNDTVIVSKNAIDEATRLEVDNQIDLVTGRVMRRGRGFMLNTEQAYGPDPDAFGHAGAGGSLGFADRKAGIGFGYAMNQMQSDISATPRSKILVDAVYSCIE